MNRRQVSVDYSLPMKPSCRLCQKCWSIAASVQFPPAKVTNSSDHLVLGWPGFLLPAKGLQSKSLRVHLPSSLLAVAPANLNFLSLWLTTQSRSPSEEAQASTYFVHSLTKTMKSMGARGLSESASSSSDEIVAFVEQVSDPDESDAAFSAESLGFHLRPSINRSIRRLVV